MMAPTLRTPPRQRPSRQSRPVRSSRTQVQSYHEDSSSDDRLDEDTESDHARAERLSHSLRPRDSNRMPTSYREETTEDEFDDFGDEGTDAISPSEAPAHEPLTFSEGNNHARDSTRSTRTRTVRTRSQTMKAKRPTKRKRMELGRPLTKRREIQVDADPYVGSGVIPPWQTLPYHILLDIFVCASYPLIDERTTNRKSSVQWLVKVALLCRAFHEPALAALYHCPPLIPAAKSHSLLQLLSQPQDQLSTNYTNKIKELHVDVEALLFYKSGSTLGYFELPKLLERTPQVKTLRLYHSHDYVVGLPSWLIQRSKWTYPDSLFDAVSTSPIRLRSWDWNSRFMETQKLLELMSEMHIRPAFHGMQELRLLHIMSEDFPHSRQVFPSSADKEIILAAALADLPELRRLEFIECSIVNDHLLPNLATNLTSLTINNCDEVTTTSFSSFIATHGRHLRELILSHNRHLSMSFIVNLAESCEQLEVFKMDISMHDWSSYHDVEPHFRELLSVSEIPTWPSTLREIELLQLRNWDDRTAEVFFNSLLNAASSLQNLRRLVISAILKIGWRDRATFREKWKGKLQKVFQRRSHPPDPRLRSIPRPSLLSHSAPNMKDGTADCANNNSDTQHSGTWTPSKRKSARIAQKRFSDDEATFTKKRPGSQEADNEEPLVIQGLCDVVMIRIDNQRPTETQFNEEDFLDDELSGDEDWNGNDIDVDDGRHAW
ncbi:uncharacterized protein BP01DRAFT_9787 [Aspergillus saccharolyticus JOP 1030-1]|uniref:Uncharacterized protein n=1 Tax=Aspergillus saccharolyticus JOP 1030-1 TaxID=1450539 RepID=A0A318ZQR1_9EURO|nr:hypothetical protein BP01DRAFT_9787 [Aspergillus saccharolyticus JOP 1030-1]PYH49941.1 hypothetical protein BP01DRAFT_9787 [Aspergillus saccharolyticus JOP 1030-1]